MRKDVRFALTVGGVFFCSIITYAIVLRQGGNSLDQTEESVTAGDPATQPAIVAPAPATKPAKSTAVASGVKSSGSASTRRSEYTRPQYASAGGSNYSSSNPTPATRPTQETIALPATKPDLSEASTGSNSTNPYWASSSHIPPANRTYASIESPGELQPIEPQHTATPTPNRTDVLAARQPPPIVNSHPPLIDSASTGSTARISPATRPIPAVDPAPEPRIPVASGNKNTHKVLSGESLWTISNAVYGNGSYFNKIALANPAIDPKHLKVGSVLVIPDLGTAPVAANSSADVTPDSSKPIDDTKQYRVQSGDTLERISNKLYGTPRVKDKIYDLNKSLIGDDPDKLKIGWVLNLPQPPKSAN